MSNVQEIKSLHMKLGNAGSIVQCLDNDIKLLNRVMLKAERAVTIKCVIDTVNTLKDLREYQLQQVAAANLDLDRLDADSQPDIIITTGDGA